MAHNRNIQTGEPHKRTLRNPELWIANAIMPRTNSHTILVTPTQPRRMLGVYHKNANAPLKGGAAWINLNPATPYGCRRQRRKEVTEHAILYASYSRDYHDLSLNACSRDIRRRLMRDSNKCPELTVLETGSEGPVSACPHRDSLPLCTPVRERIPRAATGPRYGYGRVKQASPQIACPEGGRDSGSGAMP